MPATRQYALAAPELIASLSLSLSNALSTLSLTLQRRPFFIVLVNNMTKERKTRFFFQKKTKKEEEEEEEEKKKELSVLKATRKKREGKAPRQIPKETQNVSQVSPFLSEEERRTKKNEKKKTSSMRREREREVD